jgi:hypothetical protein
MSTASATNSGRYKLGPHSLTDVQSANLHNLYAIRLAIEIDKVSACYRFAVDNALAERIQQMHLGHLMSFVSVVGSTTLFPPRNDLLNLLSTPSALAGPLAAAKTPHPLPPAVRMG